MRSISSPRVVSRTWRASASSSLFACVAACVTACVTACGQLTGKLTESSATTYVRADDDSTVIASPSVQVAGEVDEAISLEASYVVDVWTSASIDVRTAATKAIYETRHEINAGGGYAFEAVDVSSSYRYSIEPDYVSHGGVLGTAIDLAGNDARLELAAMGSLDSVGRAGDPFFEESQRSLGGRVSFTQVFGPRTLGQLSWETLYIGGFQSSVYRFVAIGGEGTCASAAPYCIPEHVPDARYRHALGALLRHALSERVSMGLGYRGYADSWGVVSQTLEPDVALGVREHGTLRLRYRYYTQGDARFYRPRYYDLAATDGFATRDRKLSAMYTHLVGAEYVEELPQPDSDAVLVLGLRATATRLSYLAFVGLEEVLALELTALVGLELR